MEPSKYQQAIFDWLEQEKGNAIITAVAGSGKTTTIEQATKRVKGTSLFLAFNKAIATEAKNRMPGIEVRTMNSFGASLIPRCKLNKDKSRHYIIFDLFDNVWKDAAPHVKVVPQLVSLMKAYGFDSETEYEEISKLADKFGLEVKDWDILGKVWDYHCQAKPSVIDFDDQIWRPVTFGCTPKKYDYVFVDECQDLNPIMIELLANVSGRKIFVGDEAQAIYGFRGADQYAIANIRSRFDCTVLPLSVCYRCGSEIVERAKRLVPEIEWHWEGGSVTNEDIHEIDPKVGDLVVCRVTKDLVIGCLDLIRKGVSATIKGREIGQGLKKVYKEGGRDFENYAATKRFKSNEQQLAFDDKCDTIFAIMDYSDDVIATIDKLFSEDARGVLFSTIHKAKGLEADKVYIIRPDLLPHPLAKGAEELVQEKNLEYVAITRAKHELVIANGEYK